MLSSSFFSSLRRSSTSACIKPQHSRLPLHVAEIHVYGRQTCQSTSLSWSSSACYAGPRPAQQRQSAKFRRSLQLVPLYCTLPSPFSKPKPTTSSTTRIRSSYKHHLIWKPPTATPISSRSSPTESSKTELGDRAANRKVEPNSHGKGRDQSVHSIQSTEDP